MRDPIEDLIANVRRPRRPVDKEKNVKLIGERQMSKGRKDSAGKPRTIPFEGESESLKWLATTSWHEARDLARET